ncbi:Oidioi.mRNA.OKI2018_I69.PAR.g10970.t2.cds [Oikopleura dioica]|uniref:Oidioi.mRNA.OKI2018_I69.PAR.g10970.t2.cds n=1 Tax=Oikopleura dioica TaxID=34765 RepID=A0ABN7RYE4_OIKDI|nr:Oidioi.mRNA.OKI2018_I69.PAR.g10970.t2.cds [Oikopleura dioica]
MYRATVGTGKTLLGTLPFTAQMIYDGYLQKYKCEKNSKLTEVENFMRCENFLHGVEIPEIAKSERIYRHEAGHLLIILLHFESLSVFPALVSFQKRADLKLNAYIKVVDLPETGKKTSTSDEEKFKSWILYSVAGKAAEAVFNGTEGTTVYSLLKRLQEKTNSRDLQIARMYASKLSDDETKQEEIIAASFYQAIKEIKANERKYEVILEAIKKNSFITASEIFKLFEEL